MNRLFNQAFRQLNVALEEDTSGKVSDEIEHVYYAQLKDLTQLQKASAIEKQEQWEIRVPLVDGFNALSGQVRIRKTEHATRSGDDNIHAQSETSPAEYALTIKCAGGQLGGRKEAAVPASEDMFTLFKFLSGKGMVKHRYTFPIDGSNRKWEVDVFLKDDGTYHDWVKIDLEVDSLDDVVPPLPVSVDMDTIVTNPKEKMSDEENKRVTKLYDDVFLTLNQYLKETTGEKPKGADKDGKTADGTDVNPEP